MHGRQPFGVRNIVVRISFNLRNFLNSKFSIFKIVFVQMSGLSKQKLQLVSIQDDSASYRQYGCYTTPPEEEEENQVSDEHD